MDWSRKTYDGREVKGQDITHQHASNIIWFDLLLNDRVNNLAAKLINKKYNNRVLPYYPPQSFKKEREWLKEYIKEDKIVYKGLVIGSIKEPDLLSKVLEIKLELGLDLSFDGTVHIDHMEKLFGIKFKI